MLKILNDSITDWDSTSNLQNFTEINTLKHSLNESGLIKRIFKLLSYSKKLDELLKTKEDVNQLISLLGIGELQEFNALFEHISLFFLYKGNLCSISKFDFEELKSNVECFIVISK